MDMSIVNRPASSFDTQKEWLNIGISMSNDGLPVVEFIKPSPIHTSYGMPGYDDQIKRIRVVEKISNAICECVAHLDIEHIMREIASK